MSRIKTPVLLLLCLCNLSAFSSPPDSGYSSELTIQKNEMWWAGIIDDGYLMPFTINDSYNFDFLGNNKMNQIQPLLISNKGRYIWCEEPFLLQIKAGKISASSKFSEIFTGQAGDNLRSVFTHVSKSYFPPSGKIPDPLFFTHPQYNTWIELTYNHNQKDILKYAKGIHGNGFPTGVLMIDDTWQTYYGGWEFNPAKFENPAKMCEQLKQMGFKTMLWVCPFVSADSPVYRDVASKGLLLKNRSDGKPAMIEWWNGFSAVLDFTNPDTRTYFDTILYDLMERYGIDGFKLDGGDTHFYSGDIVGHRAKHANHHTQAWTDYGKKFPVNEYRVAWKSAGQELVQRLHDKTHAWDDLSALIPNLLTQGLMGYAFVCPDMIGGGEWQSFRNLEHVDQELIVRSAQCHALMPMMQFSVAPWRVLSSENLAICRDMANLHVKFGSKILELAQQSAKSGEPIARHMDYSYPGNGYAKIHDQFLLGDDILVAPVLSKGARSRKVVFPPGNWKDENNVVFSGPKTIDLDAPLEKLLWFEKID